MGTGWSTVHLTILHPALFDHGVMFLEKGYRHEQMEEKNITELNLISTLMHEDKIIFWSFELLHNNREG